jgi:hypothetical protein
MKVAELEGALLDYWVAHVEALPKPRVDDGFCWFEEPACDGDPAGALEAAFAPSTDWAQAGPIIERAYIGLRYVDDGLWGAAAAGETAFRWLGDTPLIAAMRCHVAGKFGDQVPDDES